LFELDAEGNAEVAFNGFVTDGWLGDKITANRVIAPIHPVESRMYRIRLLNGGPSRFYRFCLKTGTDNGDTIELSEENIPFRIISGDGNILPSSVYAERIYLSVAQRVDVLIDFSKCKGQKLYIVNDLEQTNGKGPSGRTLDGLTLPKVDGKDKSGKYDMTVMPVMAFDVTNDVTVPFDPKNIPAKFRELPTIDLTKVKFHRTFTFDYDGGLWTINGKIMDPNRIDAGG